MLTEEQRTLAEGHLSFVRMTATSARLHATEANRLMVQAALNYSGPDLVELVRLNWWAQWNASQASAQESAAEALIWAMRYALEHRGGHAASDNLFADLDTCRAKVREHHALVVQHMSDIRDYTPAQLNLFGSNGR